MERVLLSVVMQHLSVLLIMTVVIIVNVKVDHVILYKALAQINAVPQLIANTTNVMLLNNAFPSTEEDKMVVKTLPIVVQTNVVLIVAPPVNCV